MNWKEVPGWGHPDLSDGKDTQSSDQSVERLLTTAVQAAQQTTSVEKSEVSLNQDDVLDRVFYGPDRYEL